MHHVWAILKVLIIAKLLMLAVLGVALFRSLKRNQRRFLPMPKGPQGQDPTRLS